MRSIEPAYPGATKDLVFVTPLAPKGHIPPGVDPEWLASVSPGPQFSGYRWEILDGQTTVTCSVGHSHQVTKRGILRLARAQALRSIA